MYSLLFLAHPVSDQSNKAALLPHIDCSVIFQGSHFLECQGKSGNVREFCISWNVRELSGNFDICQGIFMKNGDAE